MMQRVLVTGASGFVGRALVAQLVAHNRAVVLALTRQIPTNPVPGAQYFLVGDLHLETQWQEALAGVNTIMHTAASVHVVNDRTAESLVEFQRVNVEGTLQLARQAAAMGVRRFIFLSSIGVNGLQTGANTAFSEADPPNPHNAYARSKLGAERGLRHLAEQTGLEVVIVRPPLVYGANAPGNFRRLLKVAASGLPLPLAAIHNKRSFLALDNLIDFLITCIDRPAAANQTFLVSDGEDLSTTELLVRMAAALGKPSRLLPVPAWMLTAGAALLGKRDLVQHLCGNLQVDISKARSLLGWAPPVSVDEGLRRVVAGAQKP